MQDKKQVKKNGKYLNGDESMGIGLYFRNLKRK